MATSSAWLEPLLRSALEESWAANNCDTNSQSADFVYSHELSYLRIKPLQKQLRALKIVQLPDSEGNPERLGSDGVHALPLKFPRSKSSSPSPEPYQLLLDTDTILLSDDIEFRISDVFVPFRPELCVLSHKTTEEVTSFGRSPSCTLLRLGNVETIRQLLTEVRKQPRTQSGEPIAGLACAVPVESPTNNDQVSDDEGSLISQAQFQTQNPFTQDVGRQDVTSSVILNQRLKPPVMLSTAQKLDQERALDLLGHNLAGSPRRQASHLPPILLGAFEDEPATCRGSLSEVGEVEVRSPAPSSLLSQHPLQEAPASSLNISLPVPDSSPLQTRPQLDLADETAAQDYLVEHNHPKLSAPKPPTPFSAQRRFQHWRSAVQAEEHVPQWITQNSAMQSVLLDSEGSYCPPRKGQDLRAEFVPLHLLNALTARANQLALSSHANAAPEPSEINSNYKVEVTHPEKGMEERRVSLDSSQPVSSNAWPLSPDAVARKGALPPNSSPFQEQPRGESEASVASDVSITLDDLQPIGARARHQSATEIGHVSSQTDASAARSAAAILDGGDQQHQTDVQTHSPELVCTVPNARQEDQPALQVKRTPYPGKTIHSAQSTTMTSASPEDLNGRGNDRILSTYDEAVAPQHLQGRMIETTPLQPAVSSKPPTGLVLDSSSRSTKRQASSDAANTTDPKRRKIVSKGRCLDNSDVDYMSVMETNRARRSAELSMLTKEKAIQEQPQPASIKSSSHRNGRVGGSSSSSITSIGPGEGPGRSDVAAALSTPMTVPSDYKSHNHDADKPTDGPIRKSCIDPGSSIFQRYQATYKDYEGDSKSFSNAYTLLRRLRKARNSLHPSLFDDFIFHHYHSYRQYLQQIAESSDDPLPYAVYYDEFVESPHHRSNVVTTTTLGRTSSRNDDLDRENSNFETSRDNHSHTSGGPVGIEIPASGQTRPKHHPFREPMPEPLRDEPDNMQIENANDSGPMDPSQRSSVKTWIEGVRVASPELGTPDVQHSQEIVLGADPGSANSSAKTSLPGAAGPSSTLLPSLSASAPAILRKKKSQRSASPFVSSSKKSRTLERLDHKWWKDENTPFKQFAQRYNQISSVKLENAPSFVKPKRIDLFAWR